MGGHSVLPPWLCQSYHFVPIIYPSKLDIILIILAQKYYLEERVGTKW
jgi:hypothetical protein